MQGPKEAFGEVSKYESLWKMCRVDFAGADMVNFKKYKQNREVGAPRLVGGQDWWK